MKKNSTSAKVLEKFLKKEYINKGGADNLDVAIRDCLTDMFHIIENNKLKTNLFERLDDAKIVFDEEGAQ